MAELRRVGVPSAHVSNAHLRRTGWQSGEDAANLSKVESHLAPLTGFGKEICPENALGSIYRFPRRCPSDVGLFLLLLHRRRWSGSDAARAQAGGPQKVVVAMMAVRSSDTFVFTGGFKLVRKKVHTLC